MWFIYNYIFVSIILIKLLLILRKYFTSYSSIDLLFNNSHYNHSSNTFSPTLSPTLSLSLSLSFYLFAPNNAPLLLRIPCRHVSPSLSPSRKLNYESPLYLTQMMSQSIIANPFSLALPLSSLSTPLHPSPLSHAIVTLSNKSPLRHTEMMSQNHLPFQNSQNASSFKANTFYLNKDPTTIVSDMQHLYLTI